MYSFVKLVAGKYWIAFRFHMIRKSLEVRLKLLFIVLSNIVPGVGNVSSFLATPYQQIATFFFLFLCRERTTEVPRVFGSVSSVLVNFRRPSPLEDFVLQLNPFLKVDSDSDTMQIISSI